MDDVEEMTGLCERCKAASALTMITASSCETTETGKWLCSECLREQIRRDIVQPVQ